MKTYDFDTIDACDLESILKAGNNITITKLDDCTLEISSSGGGGNSNGIKYHLKNGDNITVQDCYEYPRSLVVSQKCYNYFSSFYKNT